MLKVKYLKESISRKERPVNETSGMLEEQRACQCSQGGKEGGHR